MKLLITLCVVIELSTVAFGVKVPRTQATCPALKEKLTNLNLITTVCLISCVY